MRTNLRNVKFFGALTASVMTLALGFALTWSPPAQGKGKPGGDPPPPEPVPDGMLYFLEGDLGSFGVLPDGTGFDPALPIPDGPYAEPSNLLYGSGSGYRLWLRPEPTLATYDIVDGSTTTDVPHRDLFVYRDYVGPDFDPRQLTDLYGSFIVLNQPRFSNDGLDSFISFNGIDIRNGVYYVDADGKKHLNGNGIDGIFRIQITGSEIDAGAVIGPEDVETVVTFQRPHGPNDFPHSWSKDVTTPKLVYVLWDGQDYDLWVKDFTGPDQKIFDGSNFTINPRFSPKTDSILFYDNPNVRTINPDGTGPAVLLQAPPYAYWSPDGEHICFTEVVQPKGNKPKEYYLSRLSLISGNVTRVTSGADKANGKMALPWVSTMFPL
jgi:hypothetical protein